MGLTIFSLFLSVITYVLEKIFSVLQRGKVMLSGIVIVSSLLNLGFISLGIDFKRAPSTLLG